MKSHPLIVSIFAILASFSHIHPSDIFQYGDYSTPGIIEGDLIVADGNIAISSDDLTVYGDIRITGGNVGFAGGGTLYVAGDITLTNTNTTGQKDSSITVTGDLIVGGDLTSLSLHGNATILADTVYVAGEVQTWATTESGDAFVYARETGGILASAINAFGGGDCSITATAGAIKVSGNINTHSLYGDGKVYAHNDLTAAVLTSYAYQDASITSSIGNLIIKGSYSSISNYENLF